MAQNVYGSTMCVLLVIVEGAGTRKCQRLFEISFYATINLKLQQFTLTPGNDPVSAAANSEAITFDEVISYSFVDRYLTFYIRNSTVDPVFFRDLPCYTSISKLQQFTVIFTDNSQASSNFLIIYVMTTKQELLIRA